MPKISQYPDGAPLQSGDKFVLARSGANYSVDGGDIVFLFSPIIVGCELLWNSSTSISVRTGIATAQNGDFINVSSLLTASSLSLSASTFYHVYIYLSSDTPAIEVVTTAPVAWKGTAYSKTGDTSRRYVGSVKTDGSGNIYAFYHSGNQYIYNASIPSTPFRVLATGTATVNTAVSVAGIVPTTSRIINIYVTNQAVSVNARIANSAGTNMFNCRNNTANAIVTFTDDSQNIYYNNSAGGGDTNIDVFGYVVQR